jgi:hypothetical protein
MNLCRETVKMAVPPGNRRGLKMLQLAPLNRVPFGKFNRASAFPVACCGVSERTTIKWTHSLHFEDSLQLAAGSFNPRRT